MSTLALESNMALFNTRSHKLWSDLNKSSQTNASGWPQIGSSSSINSVSAENRSTPANKFSFFPKHQVCFICRIFPRCRCRRLLYYGIIYSVACFIILYILDIKLNQNGNISESEQLQDAVCMKSSAWFTSSPYHESAFLSALKA